MKIFNKLFFPFLVFSFFSLIGMEEGDTLFGSEPKIERNNTLREVKTQEGQSKILINPFSLKTQCVFKILELINAGKLKWGKLAELPEGLDRYVELFHIANTYFKHPNLEPQRALFYELISLGPKDLELFVTALDDLFECLSGRNLDEDSHHLIPILQIMIDKQYMIMGNQNNNSVGIERRYRKNQVKLLIEINRLDGFFLTKVMHKNLICLINLFLELNLVTTKGKGIIFSRALINPNYSVELLKLLVERMNLTKKELQWVLADKIEYVDAPLHNIVIDCIEADMSGLKVKYLFELIENHGIEVKEIMSKKYPMRGTESKLGTLLQIAIVQINIKAVEFFLTSMLSNLE